jgi:hypothetical protein
MVFIETPIFTATIADAVPDAMYRELQELLARNPAQGDLIKGCGGLRKIRWKVPGAGKRGGIRIIYFWRVAESQILMLLAYKKADAADLTATQKRVLRMIVENWNG